MTLIVPNVIALSSPLLPLRVEPSANCGWSGVTIFRTGAASFMSFVPLTPIHIGAHTTRARSSSTARH